MMKTNERNGAGVQPYSATTSARDPVSAPAVSGNYSLPQSQDDGNSSEQDDVRLPSTEQVLYNIYKAGTANAKRNLKCDPELVERANRISAAYYLFGRRTA